MGFKKKWCGLLALITGGAAFAGKRRRASAPSAAAPVSDRETRAHLFTAAAPAAAAPTATVSTESGSTESGSTESVPEVHRVWVHQSTRPSLGPPTTVCHRDQVAEPSAGSSWTLPLADGSCPDGYPVKANDNSRIYHVPEGRSYRRTVAERCYSTAEAAESDGYRRAKA